MIIIIIMGGLKFYNNYVLLWDSKKTTFLQCKPSFGYNNYNKAILLQLQPVASIIITSQFRYSVKFINVTIKLV